MSFFLIYNKYNSWKQLIKLIIILRGIQEKNISCIPI